MIDWTKVPTHELVLEMLKIRESPGGDELVACSRAAKELDRRLPASGEEPRLALDVQAADNDPESSTMTLYLMRDGEQAASVDLPECGCS